MLYVDCKHTCLHKKMRLLILGIRHLYRKNTVILLHYVIDYLRKENGMIWRRYPVERGVAVYDVILRGVTCADVVFNGV